MYLLRIMHLKLLIAHWSERGEGGDSFRVRGALHRPALCAVPGRCPLLLHVWVIHLRDAKETPRAGDSARHDRSVTIAGGQPTAGETLQPERIHQRAQQTRLLTQPLQPKHHSTAELSIRRVSTNGWSRVTLTWFCFFLTGRLKTNA